MIGSMIGDMELQSESEHRSPSCSPSSTKLATVSWTGSISETTEDDMCNVQNVSGDDVDNTQRLLHHHVALGDAGDPGRLNEEGHLIVKQPTWRIAGLSTVGGAIDLGYAVLGSYEAPLVVSAGLELKYASLLMVISPILGLLFQVYLGALSDKCQCRWGRRRPFIVLFALTACLGMVFAPLAPRVSSLAATTTSPRLQSFFPVLGVTLTVVFLLIFDFSVGALQLPSRAYLLDVAATSQVQRGNFIYSAFIGLGALLGYILGGINWSFVFGSHATIVNQTQVIFAIVIVLYLVSLLLTVCSVKEKQPAGYPGTNTDGKTCCCSNMISSFVETIKDMVNFIFCMSKHMWLLWLTSVFGSFAIDIYLFFFTTFVGEAVYGGVSSAPVNSTLYQQYTKGVRMGSFGLAISSAVLMIVSLTLNPVANKIGIKTLFIGFQYVFVVCCFAMTIFHQIPVVLVLGAFYGPYVGMFLTIPFQLIPLYNVSHHHLPSLITTCQVVVVITSSPIAVQVLLPYYNKLHMLNCVFYVWHITMHVTLCQASYV